MVEDDTDGRIVAAVLAMRAESGRATVRGVADRIGLSSTSTHRRMKQLLDGGRLVVGDGYGTWRVAEPA